MKKILTLISICTLFSGCAVSKKIDDSDIKVNFLDEYILPSDLKFKNTKVGGLSGIDFGKEQYYLVSDPSSDPRIYLADILINNRKFQEIKIEEVIKVDNQNFKEVILDLEAIRYDPKREEIIIASEGLIDGGKDPGIFVLTTDGKINHSFKIPDYFDAQGDQRPRNNGVFEGLAISFDQQGFWAATELPLKKDGPKPKLYPTHSHVRFTKFDKNTGEAMEQFVYKLDGISKLPINYFAVNGVTEILEYAPEKFLVLERAYSAGYGSHGNTVKIFSVDASEASNTLDYYRLKGKNYELAKKKLIFDFKSVKDRLTEGIIDNIEGMCFGPKLENGNNSLILVSDNNFNSFGKQLNQFILMELNF